jgi:hypothetical protein
MRPSIPHTASAPAAFDHLENLVLLGCWLLILVLALALLSFLFDQLSKACSASADWFERKAARRKRRRTCLRKYYHQPISTPHLRIVLPPDDSLARNALRRHAESHHTGQAPSTKAAPNLRLVKPRETVKRV